MGPAKRAKAEKLGVKIIGAEEFRAMLGDSPIEQPALEQAPKQAPKENTPIQGSLF
jgi:hypothetical protein